MDEFEKPKPHHHIPLVPVIVLIAGVSIASGILTYAWSSLSTMKNTRTTNTVATENSNTATTNSSVDSAALIAAQFTSRTDTFVNDTDAPASRLFDYQGKTMFTDLGEHVRAQQIEITSISFRGDEALIGGQQKKLLHYDGKATQDISSLILGETEEERANTFPRVAVIGSSPSYWLIDVFGSGYHRVYKYDGKQMTLVEYPTSPMSSTHIESAVWTGKFWLLVDIPGRVFKYDGTAFEELLAAESGDVSIYGKVAWNGSSAIIAFANRSHTVYAYDDRGLRELDDPAYDKKTGAITEIGWNGKYWLLAGPGGLWKREDKAWTQMTVDHQTILNAKRGHIEHIEWTGSYWLIITEGGATFIVDAQGLRDITQDFLQFTSDVADIRYGATYGLIGSRRGLTRIERESRVDTVNSPNLYECYSPEQLSQVPKLQKLIQNAGLKEASFADLCVATNRNPVKRVFAAVPTAFTMNTTTKKQQPCEDCFALHLYDLETRKRIIPEKTDTPELIESGAERCEFGPSYDLNISINCELTRSEPRYAYFNIRQFSPTGDFHRPFFHEQCSIWDTDSTTPAVEGEEERTLEFRERLAKVRCGNPKHIPLSEEWVKYEQDGFSMRYPKTFYFATNDTDDGKRITVHPRNLGPFESGGPYNGRSLELRKPVSYIAALEIAKKERLGTDDILKETELRGKKAIVITPGPGLCNGEYVYVPGTQHFLVYGEYCASWHGIDQTFTVE